MHHRYLLDTCVLLDCLFKYDSISQKTKEMLEQENTFLAVSVASIWEVTIKNKKHPELMPISGSELHSLLKQLEISIVPIRAEHAKASAVFMDEKIHNDPFDHIILATAAIDGYILLTKDEKITQYRNGLALLVD